MSIAGVGAEINGIVGVICSAGIIEVFHGNKGTGVIEVCHYTHFELVLDVRLFEIELESQLAGIHIDVWHGIDAALVEDKAVVSAVCIGGRVPNHGFVLIGHGHILVNQCPTRGLHACLGGGRNVGIGVKIVSIGKVFRMKGAG